MKTERLDTERLREDVLRDLGDGPSKERLAGQQRALVTHMVGVPSMARRRPRWLVPVMATLGTAAVVLASVFVLTATRERPVEFWVADKTEPAVIGEWITSTAGQPTPIVFSGGTRFELSLSGQVQVARADHKEVRLLLRRGLLDAAVRRAQGSTWVVAAGPYRVVVTGTRFNVQWEESTGQFSLRLHEGTVRVESDERPPVQLQAGDMLRTTRGSERFEVVPINDVPVEPRTQKPSSKDAGGSLLSPETADGRSAPELLSTQKPTRPVAPPSKLVLASVPRPNDWRTLFSQGDYAGALNAFEQTRQSPDLRELDVEGLRILSDAARYAGRPEIAERALVMIRKRGGGTEAAEQAAFLLGRLYADLRHDDAQAAVWFGVYLKESPSGPLAEEALGRRVDSLAKAGLQADAAAAAREYLERYPAGVFAALARSLAQ